jgi:hypothetical protein
MAGFQGTISVMRKGEHVRAFKEEGETHIIHDAGSVLTKLKGCAQSPMLFSRRLSSF